MKTTILLTIEHTKPLPDITDVICQRVWPYGGGCITDMTAAIQEEGEKQFHDALQRVGTALGLQAGSDLTSACVPAILALRDGSEAADLLRRALAALESCGAGAVEDGGQQWFDDKLVDAVHAAIQNHFAGTIRVGNETFSKERMREAIKAGRAQQ